MVRALSAESPFKESVPPEVWPFGNFCERLHRHAHALHHGMFSRAQFSLRRNFKIANIAARYPPPA
jgi:hypothetical protein